MLRRVFVPILSGPFLELLQAQAARPDFTGVWRLNISESKLGKSSPLPYYSSFQQTIKQSGERIDIREDITAPNGMHRVSIFAFKTDGQGYTPTSGLPGTVVSGKWKGDTLIEKFSEEGSVVTRKMRLSPDRKRIFAEWQFTPATGGPQIATEVWDRQQ
jgi:hypothetical protein